MIAFIDDHRDVHGVEPICRVLPIAPSTYHDHVAKRADPSRLSARAKQDATLRPEIARVFAENFAVYRARKVWRQLEREGVDVARCTVERLMKDMDLQGVIRGRPVRTTISDKAAPCPLDHVNRQFHAPRPNVHARLGDECCSRQGRLRRSGKMTNPLILPQYLPAGSAV
jgi:putative transposase